MFAYLRRNKGEEMPDSTTEDLLKAHIVTLQKCDVALGQCIEVACKMLEQMRIPHAAAESPTEVPWIKVESDGGMTAWRPDPGPAMPGAAIELSASSVLVSPEELKAWDNCPAVVDPIPPEAPAEIQAIAQGVRYEGDTPFNSGHTAVIKYE